MELIKERLWSWCKNCLGLHHSGERLGKCPFGGEHSIVASGCYTLWCTYSPADQPPADVPGAQGGFRRCGVCKCLFHRSQADGRCRSGYAHAADGELFNSTRVHWWYWMPRQGGSAPEPLVMGQEAQSGWRWCCKCSGIFHADSGAGACFAGGQHDASGSGAYAPTLGPLFAATTMYVLGTWPFVAKTPVCSVGADGVLRLVAPSYENQGLSVEPTGDGRVWLRASASNLYVVVHRTTRTLRATAGRDQATPFVATHLGEGKLRFEVDGELVTAPGKLTDPLKLKSPSFPTPDVPEMVVSVDRTLFVMLGMR